MTTHDSEPSTDMSADSSESPDEPMTDRDTNRDTDTDTDTDTEPNEAAETRLPDTGPAQAGAIETGPDAEKPAGSTTAGDQLVPQEAVMDFRARWEAIQQGFVDDPRSAVTDADSLVSDVLDKLSTAFDEQHGRLEAQWNEGEPDTEELRSALQRYRDFFDRLLSI
jgi:hypothetical protein